MRRNIGPNINLAYNSCCNIDVSTSSNIDMDMISGNAAMYDVEVDITINPSNPTTGPDYNNLRNKPSINGITIQGEKPGSYYSLATIYYNTVAGWEEQQELVGLIDCIYIYTDYKIIDNKTIFGIKIGDGVSYLKDIPFTDYGADYNVLINKPKINSVELFGNKTLFDLGISNTWWAEEIYSSDTILIDNLHGKNGLAVESGDYIYAPATVEDSSNINALYYVVGVQSNLVEISEICSFEKENIYFSFTVDDLSVNHTVTPGEGVTVRKIFEAYQNGKNIFAKANYLDENEVSILKLSEISNGYVTFTNGRYGNEFFVSIHGESYNNNDYWNAAFEYYLNRDDLAQYRTAAAQNVIDNALSSAINEKYTKPSTGIPSSDFDIAVQSLLTGSSIFTAIYGYTTSSEIEDAYQAGKACFCNKDNVILSLAYRVSSTYHIFTMSYNNMNYIVTCQNSIWNKIDRELAKLTDIPFDTINRHDAELLAITPKIGASEFNWTLGKNILDNGSISSSRPGFGITNIKTAIAGDVVQNLCPQTIIIDNVNKTSMFFVNEYNGTTWLRRTELQENEYIILGNNTDGIRIGWGFANNQNVTMTQTILDNNFAMRLVQKLGSGGTMDYEDLSNKPQIDGVILSSNTTSSELGFYSLPSGGNDGDIIMKRTNTDYDAYWVAPASSAEQDNTRPITAAAVYTEIGNINALLATI